jgi:hypothetical protein
MIKYLIIMVLVASCTTSRSRCDYKVGFEKDACLNEVKMEQERFRNMEIRNFDRLR